MGPSRDAAPLVGREREIDALNAACDRCREGLAITAYVHGPSGMGKTALVAHFLESRESESDAVVLSGGHRARIDALQGA